MIIIVTLKKSAKSRTQLQRSTKKTAIKMIWNWWLFTSSAQMLDMRNPKSMTILHGARDRMWHRSTNLSKWKVNGCVQRNLSHEYVRCSVVTCSLPRAKQINGLLVCDVIYTLVCVFFSSLVSLRITHRYNRDISMHLSSLNVRLYYYSI